MPRLVRAVVVAVLWTLTACEGDGGGGDGGPGDAGPPDGGAADVITPLAAPAARYRFDPEGSTCVPTLALGQECVTATTSGPDLMLWSGRTVLTGAWDETVVELDDASVRAFHDRELPLAGCTARPPDGAPRLDFGRLAFTCEGPGGACTLALEAAPECGGPPPPVVTDPIVDPTDLTRVSKYNSCVGHEWGCPLVEGCLSSLKHYLTAAPEHVDRDDTLRVYAPCDGHISWILEEQNRLPCLGGAVRGQQLRVVCDAATDLEIVLFHVNPEPDIEQGRGVLAGDPLGFADVRGCDDPAPSFDIAALRHGAAVFPFAHMTPEALAPWLDWGVMAVADDLRLTDAARGVCTFAGPAPEDHWFAP